VNNNFNTLIHRRSCRWTVRSANTNLEYTVLQDAAEKEEVTQRASANNLMHSKMYIVDMSTEMKSLIEPLHLAGE
jgi:hypothetical protein